MKALVSLKRIFFQFRLVVCLCKKPHEFPHKVIKCHPFLGGSNLMQTYANVGDFPHHDALFGLVI